MTDTMAGASTIDGVLDCLDAEIARAVREQSRLAYFACLYRLVTRRVRDGIRSGRFEDGPRMERFDVIFARRYLDALAAYRAGRPTTRSWRSTFAAAESGRLTILQHLLLGMNAHINLDLGIAAAQTSPGSTLPGLKRDFDEISNLLSEMLDDVQLRLSTVSPWLGLLDRVGGRSDEEICTFCLGGSRDLAWRSAKCVAEAPATSLAAEIHRLDCAVDLLARPIRWPGIAVGAALLLVRAREPREVGRVVEALV